jgi:hypothetical protein
MSTIWADRIEIKSESSSRIYVVARNVSTGAWGCSCPGWKSHRTCKHLKSMGLAAGTHEVTRPAARGRGVQSANFTDSAYKHYDVRANGGFGSPDEWFRLAEQMAHGRKRYAPPPRQHRQASGLAADMKLLGITEMPPDAKGLVRAMRRQAMVTHPDHGGSAEAFRTMFAAYERLLRRYPR